MLVYNALASTIMDRRKDLRTAELVGIAVLTRDAFGVDRAYRYAILAGISGTLMSDVLHRPKSALRHMHTMTGSLDRRQLNIIGGVRRRRTDRLLTSAKSDQ